MSILTVLLSPFNLLFLISIIGFALGKIRIKCVSIGIAGVLFSGILVGFLYCLINQEVASESIETIQTSMKTFSKLGSSLFVSVIGIQTGLSLKHKSKESLIAFLIGGLMSIFGGLTMLIISVLDKTLSLPSLLGILCGALTSTPGLSSVCERINVNAAEATWSYGCSYLFGVVFVVLFVQLLSKKTETKKCQNHDHIIENKQNSCYELLLISVVSLIGGILGSIDIPFLDFSLGNTACTLLAGLIVGNIIERKVSPIHISLQSINSIRNLGLTLFFAGTGFSTGTQSISFNLKALIYGILITSTTLLGGWLLCKLFISRYSLHMGFVISGGMTSSPAYGAISSQTDNSVMNHFSFAYFGALISLMISIQTIIPYTVSMFP